MARHVAKNIVAAGLADKRARCSSRTRSAWPTRSRVMVDTIGTAKVPEAELVRAVREIFPLTPKGIIEYLDLRRPIYRKTAAYGHFGRSEPDFTWEKTDKAAELKAFLKH